MFLSMKINYYFFVCFSSFFWFVGDFPYHFSITPTRLDDLPVSWAIVKGDFLDRWNFESSFIMLYFITLENNPSMVLATTWRTILKSLTFSIMTRSRSYKYCPLWAQKGHHGFKNTSIWLKRASTYTAPRNFSHIWCRTSQTSFSFPSPMQTQRPRCVPWDCRMITNAIKVDPGQWCGDLFVCLFGLAIP